MCDSEEELVESLKKIDIKKYIAGNLKGYMYIESFQKQIMQGSTLEKKQMTQLKRNAKEIYKYVNQLI